MRLGLTCILIACWVHVQLRSSWSSEEYGDEAADASDEYRRAERKRKEVCLLCSCSY